MFVSVGGIVVSSWILGQDFASEVANVADGALVDASAMSEITGGFLLGLGG